MLASSMLRFFASKSYVRRAEKSAWHGIQLSIWLNSLAWGTIFGFSSFELHNSSFHFSVLITVLAGTLAGSLVTLSNNRSLYIPFMASCMAPMMIVALIQWLRWDQSAGGYLFILYVVFSIYQTLQFMKIRELQVDRLTTQVNLEESLFELKNSQNAFVSQTAKLFHASKLSALGEMAGGLSHEVNNSLMTIMGSIEQLDRYFQRDNIENSEYRKKIQNSKEAIHQIKTVIDGLRFFSQQSDEAEKVDRPLEEIIQRTLNFCNEMIKANEITMIVAPGAVSTSNRID
jgi:signal transduction histidine kinase